MEWREPFSGGAGIFFASMYNDMPMKTPLRYPGGKSKYAARILGNFPKVVTYPDKYWINDADGTLIAFYREVQSDPDTFVNELLKLNVDRDTFNQLAFNTGFPYQGVRFLYLNKTVWGGRVRPSWPSRMYYADSNNWSPPKSIDPVRKAHAKLSGVTITNLDFTKVIEADGNDVFLYCDPPYMSDTLASGVSKLYEHGFTLEDHTRLSECLKGAKHNFVLSYDDHDRIRELYSSWCKVIEVPWINHGSAGKGRQLKRNSELLITNIA